MDEISQSSDVSLLESSSGSLDPSDSENTFDKSLFRLVGSVASFLTLSPIFSADLDSPPPQEAKNPTDISIVPDVLAAYPEDRVDQSTILDGIVATARHQLSSEERFNNMAPRVLKLSKLKTFYEDSDVGVVNYLSTRHKVRIDRELLVPFDNNQVVMNTDESMIDYLLTVGNRIGFSPLLPKTQSAPRFSFEMDLKKPFIAFKGKYAMLGFDPAGSMLFIGRCNNEDVFLAMAPNEFLRGHTRPTPAGHSSASPLMSRRHYRQILMMIVHFLALLPGQAYYNVRSVYNISLDAIQPNFESITDTLYVFILLPSNLFLFFSRRARAVAQYRATIYLPPFRHVLWTFHRLFFCRTLYFCFILVGI